MGKTLIFEKPEELPQRRDASEYRFPFRVVNSELVGEPEELARSSRHVLDVGVSGTLETCWQLPKELLPRVLFEYGRRYLKQKIVDGALTGSEELLLHTGNAESPCPFDPARIDNPAGAVLEIEDGVKPFMKDLSFLQLASRIIDARDNINALFHEKHGEKLVTVREERDLLQFFRDATSSEEFFYRICALANAATGLNVPKLRLMTGIIDTQIKSIKLLEAYLSQSGHEDETTIRTLQAINNIRQGYPVHGDRSDGFLGALKYFGLTYPVSDYSGAWRTMLLSYLDVLERLLDKLKGNLAAD